MPEITHIVYVDPLKYSELTERNKLEDVGRVIGKLNKLLPKRRFILMGPGRWGSRGDIKLGVGVTYSDINNTTLLIEIARKKGNYVPDLSFGTHFFQDLVEAQIRYLPLYPDDEGIAFNDEFLLNSHNLLPEMLPDYAYLAEVIKLIDVPQVTGGHILRILMNADQDRAVGLLRQPSMVAEKTVSEERPAPQEGHSEHHWRWRHQAAEFIANQVEPERFGVVAVYLFGSTKNAHARPDSDIDLLVHFRGTDEQLTFLKHWLEGWSLSLDEQNYLRTGHRRGGILDIHIVTDEEVKNKTGYASKIDAVTDPARKLQLKKKA